MTDLIHVEARRPRGASTHLTALAAALVAWACSDTVVDLGENQEGGGGFALSRCSSSTSVAGPIVVESRAQLEELDGCEVVEGGLTIAPFESADLQPLHALRYVGGPLWIGQLPYPETGIGDPAQQQALLQSGWLDSLAGLESLRRVDGGITLVGIAAESLEPLSGLTYAGTFSLSLGHSLETLAGLENVEPVIGVDIRESPHLYDVTALRLAEEMDQLNLDGPIEAIEASAVRRVGWLILQGTKLTSLEAFAGVTDVGRLGISTNDALVDGSALNPSVDELTVGGNPQLVRLANFDVLMPIEIVIGDNASLLELPTFDGQPRTRHDPVLNVWNLDEVRRFMVSSNASLERIVFPAGIRRINDVFISDHSNLREIDFGAVEGMDILNIRENAALESVTLGSLSGVPLLRVVDNPSLDPAVFDDLATFEREMSGNAP